MGYDDHVKLIGVGKDSHMSNLSNWTGGNDASVTADAQSEGFPAWDEWDARSDTRCNTGDVLLLLITDVHLWKAPGRRSADGHACVARQFLYPHLYLAQRRCVRRCQRDRIPPIRSGSVHSVRLHLLGPCNDQFRSLF